MSETVKDRLIRFLQAEKISNSEFARKMGLSTAYVGAMRKSMPEDKVTRLIELYPYLNRDWLLYGEGDMYRHLEEGKDVPEDLAAYVVPLLPVEAYAGNLQMWSEGVALKDCEKIVAPMKGVDFAIKVSGDSMEPFVFNGNVMLIKKINDRAFIPWGNPLVIDTENGVLFKVVEPSPDGKDFIEVHSYNPKYKPFAIHRNSIFGLYRVLTTINSLSTLF
ncbi:MAG: LexA family transcriptional regulator [Bacteroides sp.]|nr:LexA family transcriptional regulator [Bacteroides sp.]